MDSYLTEAFKALNILSEDVFTLDDSSIHELDKYMNDSGDDLTIYSVVDPEATTEDELEKDYIGKVILECGVCHSLNYENKDEIILDEDSELVNVEKECPFCHSTYGFKIIGEVADYHTDEDNHDDADDDPDARLADIETDEEDEAESIEEATKTLVKPLSEVDGTLGNVLNKHADELSKVTDAHSALAFLDSIEPEVTQKDYLAKVKMNIRKAPHRAQTYLYDILLKGDGKGLTEDINNLTIDTDETHMEMKAEDDDKVTIITEPIQEEDDDSSDEVIAELDTDTEDEIVSNNAEETEEETEEKIEETPAEESDSVDVDVDEFDEESFDELGESYLKSIYENVDKYNTTNIIQKADNQLVVEGVITFKSGAKKSTQFIFESISTNGKGLVKFVGQNSDITPGKKAFKLRGTLESKKLIAESLTYNYLVKDNDKNKRINGTIKRSK